MPNRHKSKHDPDVVDGISCASQGDIDISKGPEVVTLVPAAPESQGRVVVGHTSQHVLGGLNAIQQCPKSEEAPDNHQLEPNQNQVEESNHADLKNGVVVPGLTFADRYHMHVVHCELHRQEAEDETADPHVFRLLGDLLGVSQLVQTHVYTRKNKNKDQHVVPRPGSLVFVI